jgi:hypothetical protein
MTGVGFVNIMLYDSGPHHRRATGEESERNLLQWTEVNPETAKSGIDEEIADRDKDDQSERVQVGKYIVG